MTTFVDVADEFVVASENAQLFNHKAFDLLGGNLFALESSLVALFALILSLLVAVPCSAGLATILGKHALHIDVILQFSWTAFGLWLSLLGLVCALATLIPVQREFSIVDDSEGSSSAKKRKFEKNLLLSFSACKRPRPLTERAV